MHVGKPVFFLVVIAVGALTLAGLIVHGVAGGVLLLVVGALLVTLSLSNRAQRRRDLWPLRLLVIAGVLALATVKLLG